MLVEHPYHNPAHSKEQWCQCVVDSLSPKHKAIYGLTLSRVHPRPQRVVYHNWYSLVLYPDETIWIESAVDSLNFTRLTCQNYICQHPAIAETSVKQLPSAFILFDFQQWDSPASFASALFQCGKRPHLTRNNKMARLLKFPYLPVLDNKKIH